MPKKNWLSGNKHNLDVLIEVKRKEELINSVNKLHNLGYIQ